MHCLSNFVRVDEIISTSNGDGRDERRNGDDGDGTPFCWTSVELSA